MEARHFYKASQVFAYITIVCMALTLASSLVVFNPHEPSALSARPAPVPNSVAGRARPPQKSHKRSRRKPKAPAPSLTPAPIIVPATPERPATPYGWIMFVATMISAVCGFVSTLLGVRADRRAAKAETVSGRQLVRDSPRRR